MPKTNILELLVHAGGEGLRILEIQVPAAGSSNTVLLWLRFSQCFGSG